MGRPAQPRPLPRRRATNGRAGGTACGQCGTTAPFQRLGCTARRRRAVRRLGYAGAGRRSIERLGRTAAGGAVQWLGQPGTGGGNGDKRLGFTRRYRSPGSDAGAGSRSLAMGYARRCSDGAIVVGLVEPDC
jgi:hypothetical protein